MLTAYSIAAASSGEYVSRVGSSRVAHAAEAEVDHARAVVDRPADRLAPPRRARSCRRCGRPSRRAARPGSRCRRFPAPLFSAAAISPATNVPWPFVSFCQRARRRSSRRRRSGSASSGWSASMPESMTATRTAGRGGSCGQASKAWMRFRYHWRTASGSFGVNERRRESREALDPGDARNRAEALRAGRVDGERERADARDTAAGARFDPLRDDARRDARSGARPRSGRPPPARAPPARGGRPRARAVSCRSHPQRGADAWDEAAAGSEPRAVVARGQREQCASKWPRASTARARPSSTCSLPAAGRRRSPPGTADARSRAAWPRSTPRKRRAERPQRGRACCVRCRSRAGSRSSPSAWPRRVTDPFGPRATRSKRAPGLASLALLELDGREAPGDAAQRDPPAERHGRVRRREREDADAEPASSAGRERARTSLPVAVASPSEPTAVTVRTQPEGPFAMRTSISRPGARSTWSRRPAVTVNGPQR